MSEQPSPSAALQANSTSVEREELLRQLEDLLSEVGAVAQRLRQGSSNLAAADDLDSGGHNVLRILSRFESRTVPQIARLDSSSRQNIQTVVNRLERKGCVELISNPAHKRSPLVRLTNRGLDCLGVLDRNEQSCRETIMPVISQVELTIALELLRRIREALSVAPKAQGHRIAKARLTGDARKLTEPQPPARATGRIEFEESRSDENELPISLL